MKESSQGWYCYIHYEFQDIRFLKEDKNQSSLSSYHSPCLNSRVMKFRGDLSILLRNLWWRSALDIKMELDIIIYCAIGINQIAGQIANHWGLQIKKIWHGGGKRWGEMWIGKPEKNKGEKSKENQLENHLTEKKRNRNVIDYAISYP